VADILLGALDPTCISAASEPHPNMGRLPCHFASEVGRRIVSGAWLGASRPHRPRLRQPGLDRRPACKPALLVALVGLSAFQARRHPRLVWAAFAIPAVGVLLSIVGMTAMAVRGDLPLFRGVSNWEIWMLGTFLMVVGSGLFAVASLRTGTVSRAGSVLLGIAAIAGVVAVPVLSGLVSWEPLVSIAFLAFLLGSAGGSCSSARCAMINPSTSRATNEASLTAVSGRSRSWPSRPRRPSPVTPTSC
jgi:hypothetical protein